MICGKSRMSDQMASTIKNLWTLLKSNVTLDLNRNGRILKQTTFKTICAQSKNEQYSGKFWQQYKSARSETETSLRKLKEDNLMSQNEKFTLDVLQNNCFVALLMCESSQSMPYLAHFRPILACFPLHPGGAVAFTDLLTNAVMSRGSIAWVSTQSDTYFRK